MSKATAISLLSLLILLLAGCHQSHHRPEHGRLHLLDLDHDFADPHTLDGEWQFFPGRLYLPSELSTDTTISSVLVKVPSMWGNYTIGEGQRMPVENSGTFRLVVELGKNTDELGLFVPKIWGANRVYVNGQLVSEKGTVTLNVEEYEALMIHNLIQLPPIQGNGEMEIVVQVSNYNFFLGGLIESFWLGKYDDLRTQYNLENTWALMWIGCLLLMGAYHIILFVFRKKNISVIYFGGLCLLIAVRLMIFGDHYFYVLLKEDWAILSTQHQVRLYYLTTYLLGPMGLLYVRSIYPRIFKWAWPINSLFILIGVFTLYAIPAPNAYLNPVLQPVFVVVIVPSAISIFYTLIVAALRKEKESAFQMIGIAAVLLAGINDVAHGLGIEIIGEIEFTPVAFGVFMIIQFIVLAKRYSDALNSEEDLTANLEKKVAQRTNELAKSRDEIVQKGQALEQAYDSITDSVKYASRIQRSLMGTQKSVTAAFDDSLMLFKPRDIVSGDFYWYAEVECNLDEQGNETQGCKTLQILIAADCTGHGVPGAFMTVIGHNSLDEIVHEKGIFEPSMILAELDKRVVKVFHDQEGEKRNEGMDMAILVIDQKNRKVQYSGAKNPLWWTRDGDQEMRVIKASKFPIGGHQHPSKKFETHTIELHDSDKFFIFSDGFQDQFGGPSGRKYMTKRFRHFLFTHSHLSMEELEKKLDDEFVSWKDQASQTDDVLVMGICVSSH